MFSIFSDLISHLKVVSDLPFCVFWDEVRGISFTCLVSNISEDLDKPLGSDKMLEGEG